MIHAMADLLTRELETPRSLPTTRMDKLKAMCASSRLAACWDWKKMVCVMRDMILLRMHVTTSTVQVQRAPWLPSEQVPLCLSDTLRKEVLLHVRFNKNAISFTRGIFVHGEYHWYIIIAVLSLAWLRRCGDNTISFSHLTTFNTALHTIGVH